MNKKIKKLGKKFGFEVLKECGTGAPVSFVNGYMEGYNHKAEQCKRDIDMIYKFLIDAYFATVYTVCFFRMASKEDIDKMSSKESLKKYIRILPTPRLKADELIKGYLEVLRVDYNLPKVFTDDQIIDYGVKYFNHSRQKMAAQQK